MVVLVGSGGSRILVGVLKCSSNDSCSCISVSFFGSLGLSSNGVIESIRYATFSIVHSSFSSSQLSHIFFYHFLLLAFKDQASTLFFKYTHTALTAFHSFHNVFLNSPSHHPPCPASSFLGCCSRGHATLPRSRWSQERR